MIKGSDQKLPKMRCTSELSIPVANAKLSNLLTIFTGIKPETVTRRTPGVAVSETSLSLDSNHLGFTKLIRKMSTGQ